MKQRFCSILSEKLNLDRIAPIYYKQTGGILNKPEGGLWASPCFNDEEGYKSDWHRFISENKFMNERRHGATFQLKEKARILEIVEIKDVEELVQSYAFDCHKDFRLLTAKESFDDYLSSPSEGETPSLSQIFSALEHSIKQRVEINWEQFFEDYDAIYVDSFFSGKACFMGWDVDTLLIGNKEIIEPTSIEYWVRD